MKCINIECHIILHSLGKQNPKNTYVSVRILCVQVYGLRRLTLCGNKIKTRQASSAIFTINYRALPHTDFTKSTAKQPPVSSVKWNIHPSSLQNLKQKTSLFELQRWLPLTQILRSILFALHQLALTIDKYSKRRYILCVCCPSETNSNKYDC